jgi:hypothetical protein
MEGTRLAPSAALRERLRQINTERRRIQTLLRLAELEERERASDGVKAKDKVDK